MSYSVLKFDKITQQVANQFGKQFRAGQAFLANVQKVLIENGTNKETVPIPASMTATTRVAGGGTETPQTVVPTAPEIVANKEHTATLRIDRLDSVGSQYNIKEFQATSAVNAIMASLNGDLWTEADSVTNSVGDVGEIPAITILNSAEKALFDADVPPNSELFCVTGSAEFQAWKNAMTVSDQGVLGSGVISSGKLYSAYGFNLSRDSQRTGTSDTDAKNIAFHPYAFAVGYRNYLEPIQGEVMSQAIDPITGVTIFAILRGYNDSNGKGNLVEFTIVAEPKLVYKNWAVTIEG